MQTANQEGDRLPEHIVRTWTEKECNVPDCSVTRFSEIGLEYHHLRDHMDGSDPQREYEL